jgi:multidrug resistance efflux pump
LQFTSQSVVVSLNDTQIAAQIHAVAEQVLVKVGDTFKAGAMLVKLVCKDFEFERSRLRAEQRTIQSRLDLHAGNLNKRIHWSANK